MEFFSALWAIFTKAALANLTGIQGVIGRYVLQYGGKALYDILDKWVKDHERAKAQKAAEAKLDVVVKNPASTADDVGKAYENTMNAGR